jgi:hypothetical protein
MSDWHDIMKFGLNEIDDFRVLANRMIDMIEITTDKKEKERLGAALLIILSKIQELRPVEPSLEAKQLYRSNRI